MPYGVGYNSLRKKLNNHAYKTWVNMFEKCYSEKYQEKNPYYKGCKVAEIWHDYSNFYKWYNENYYEVKNEKMQLDKDIVVKGNRIYSPETCVFVPSHINSLIANSKRTRGNYPVGVTYRPERHRFVARISMDNKISNIGSFATANEAFNAYKVVKEKHIQEIADRYSPYIPAKLYDSMYKYEININD